jgi:polyisoprenoid-binding protein YceI
MKTKLMTALFLYAGVCLAETQMLISQKGTLNFEAIGKPAMIKIKGESDAPKTKVTFEVDKVSLESILQLDNLKTGIELRDEHMKEKYLEVVKFPQAKLFIKTLPIPLNWRLKPESISEKPFEGLLTLHGIEKAISGTFTLEKEGDSEAKFKIKLSDFGIEIPEYLGVKVADFVDIKTTIKFGL